MKYLKDLKLKDIDIELGRRSFIDFITYTMPDFEVNPHHLKIAEYVEAFINRDIKNLIISCPPRHGKSEMVSRRLPAYLFGKNPNNKIISASYSADLSSRMNRDVQRIIDSDRYRDLFSNTNLNSKTVRIGAANNYVRNSDMFEIVGKQGVYRSTGVGGGITGMGCDFAIIDDPIKDHEEANSPRIRQKIWDWYVSTLLTRVEGNGGVLVCQTRWHLDDLVGRLEDDKSFEVLNLKAIDIDGNALWPSRYDIEFLNERKKQLGTQTFESLYQQSPIIDGGNIIKSDWINESTVWPNCNEYIQSWDLAFKGKSNSDYTVGQVWGRSGMNFYLIDQFRGKWDFVETIKQIKRMTAKYPKAVAKLIEDKANGPALISSLKGEISGLIAVNPKGDKISRLHAVSPLFEAGNVFINEDLKDLYEFTDELVSFPSSKHDDQVDAMTQALSYLNKSYGKSFATSGRSTIGVRTERQSIFDN